MAMPGWYPDPSGTPDQLRWWDGGGWTDQVRRADQGPEPGRRSPIGWLVLLLALVLLAAAVLWWRGRGTGAPESTDSSTPSVSAWDERGPSTTPTATPSATPTQSGGTKVACPSGSSDRRQHPQDGRLHGGGLAMEVPAQFSEYPAGFARYLDDRAAAAKSTQASSWLSFVALGKVPRTSFPSARSATTQLLQCHLSSSNFPGLVDVKVTHSAATRVGGHPGWTTTTTVTSTSAPGGGAAFEVVAVDVEDGWWAVYWSGVTLADTDAFTSITSARDGLDVQPE